MIRTPGFLLLLCLCALTQADGLDPMPPGWQQLQPIPRVDVSGAEPLARQALEQTRSEVARLLADPASDPRALARAFGTLGNLYQLYGVDALAESCYANARLLAPDRFRWAYYAAWLALSKGRLEQAVERLQQAARLNPDYAPLALRLGQAWYDLNRPQQARAALERAAREPGLRAAALYYLGQLALQERRYPEAVAHFQEALALDPAADILRYPLARAYRGMGKTASAREQLALRGHRMPLVDDPLLQEMKALERGARPLFARAMREVEKGAYQAGAASFREGLARDPDNRNARVSLARALYLARETPAARAELERVLAEDPGQTLAGFLLGVLDAAAGKGESAERYLRQVLAQDPAHAGAHYFLANLLMARKDFSAAARHYAAALESGAENPPARLLGFVARYRAGEPEAAIAGTLDREVGRFPQQQLLRYALARLLALSRDPRVQDPPRALVLARKLVDSLPIPPHLELLALALAASGESGQATGLLQQLVAGAAWMGGESEMQRLQGVLERLQAGRLPAQPWPGEDPLLQPPPVDAALVFREYPAAVPY